MNTGCSSVARCSVHVRKAHMPFRFPYDLLRGLIKRPALSPCILRVFRRIYLLLLCTAWLLGSRISVTPTTRSLQSSQPLLLGLQGQLVFFKYPVALLAKSVDRKCFLIALATVACSGFPEHKIFIIKYSIQGIILENLCFLFDQAR